MARVSLWWSGSLRWVICSGTDRASSDSPDGESRTAVITSHPGTHVTKTPDSARTAC